MMERLFTAYQVADILGRQRHEVQGWIESGDLASHRLDDGTVRISEKHVLRFLHRQGVDMEALMAQTLQAERQNTSADERAKLLSNDPPEPSDLPDAPLPALLAPAAEAAGPRVAMAAHVIAALETDSSAPPEGPLPGGSNRTDDRPYQSFTEAINGLAAAPQADDGPPENGSYVSDVPQAVAIDEPALPDPPEDEPQVDEAPPAAVVEPEETVEPPPREAAACGFAPEPETPEPDEPAIEEHAPAPADEADEPAVEEEEPAPTDEEDEPAVEDQAPAPLDDEADDNQAPQPEPSPRQAPACGFAPEPEALPLPVEDAGDESQAHQIVRAILTDAVTRGATAIRLEARGDQVTLRMRLDGLLQERKSFKRRLPGGMGPKLIDELRSLARLNGEVSGPQTSRVETTAGGRAIELGVSALPTVGGQEIVVRLGGPAVARKDLTALGMARADARTIEAMLDRTVGLIVVAAPPRHGTAETLGAMTARLADGRRGVLAIQRGAGPDLTGATQCRCGGRRGMAWDEALWAAEDHDCDVVAVEDIGDPATAAAAVESALAGRSVLAGMRAPSPVEAIRLLVRMGVGPWPLAASLLGVLAQRRVPALCPHCRQPVRHAKDHLAALGLTADDVDFETFGPNGCDACGRTGYVGTALLTAVTPMTEALADAIRDGADAETLATAAPNDLLTAALRRVRKADVALADLVRATITRT